MSKQHTVLIVDPQIDFVSGSLAVPGGDKALDWLAVYLREHWADITQVVVTLDEHTADHCSFLSQGGEWPPHCIRYTVGAAIYPPISDVLAFFVSKGIPILYLEKATDKDVDAYSAFEEVVPECLRQANRICVAGLAGDFCVKKSVEDLKKYGLGDKIELLQRGIAYINSTTL
ncbi:pyrazinamidase [Porphyromonas crevioricanis]|uniref:isochorismatase family protein n=1 Tax=Porphyromonas crevioricanis TaxID=393921 RepID=UPI00052E1ED1|nr:isochorismatase family protein [Porphyromonas crevioricanis]KGN91037.1 pyrazinamidase [Porphyromonas crevioricanis]